MSILIACPGCASKFRVADIAAGKRVKCKSCGGPIPVPAHEDVEIRVIEDEEDLAAKAVAAAEARVAPAPAMAVKSLPPPPPVRSHLDEPSDGPSWDDEDVNSPVPSAGIAALAPPPVPTYARPMAAAPAYGAAPVGYRPARQRDTAVRQSTAGPEGFSPPLLFTFVLGTIILLIVVSVRAPSSDVAKGMWTTGVTLMVMFFIVMTPMTLGGVWVASKAMRFELASPSYLKAGAVAALPMLMLMSLAVLPRNLTLAGTIVLAIIPVTFLITKLLFSLLPGEAILSFFLGSVGWVIGRFIALFFTGLIVAGMAPGKHSTQASNDNSQIGPGFGPSNSSNDGNAFGTPHRSQGSTPRMDGVTLDLTSLKVDISNARSWIAGSSRESVTDRAKQLRTRLDELAPTATTDDQKTLLTEVTNSLDEYEADGRRQPSERPDPLIFKPITETASFGGQASNDGTVVPTSFGKYRLVVPKEMAIDLGSVEDSAEGLMWHSGSRMGTECKLTIASEPRKDPRQQRPWVKTKPFMSSDNHNLLELDETNTRVDVTYGSINGLGATRIASIPADTTKSNGRFHGFESRWVKYVIADGPSWVTISCAAPADDSRNMFSLEESVRSLHVARADEPKTDPFTPEAVVDHLDDPHADALIRRMGHTAEPALLAKLKDEAFGQKEKVIKLLGDVGTKDSVVPLMLVARADDYRLSPLAKEAIKKISPDDMDDATDAILSLQSRRGTDHNEALRKLAGCKPKADDPRKAGVTTLLTDMLKDVGAMFNTDPGLLGDALAVWQTPAAIPTLLPLLDNEPQLFNTRKSVMMALAHTKDKRVVFPICRWLMDDTEDAEKALIAMGPVAEYELDKLLSYKEAKARMAVVRILSQTGTTKSLKPLDNFLYDYKKDAMSVTLGQGAIDAIKDRIAHPNATPAAASGTDPAATTPPTDPNSALFGPPGATAHPRRAPRVPTPQSPGS